MGVIFDNAFEKDIGVYLSEAFKRAELKLKKENPVYSEKMTRRAELQEELCSLFDGKESGEDTDYKELLGEYLDIEIDTRKMERYSIYLQAYLDCMSLMRMGGWIG